MTTASESLRIRPVQGRIATSRGLWTMVVALVLLAFAGLFFASTSMSKGALQGCCPSPPSSPSWRWDRPW